MNKFGVEGEVVFEHYYSADSWGFVVLLNDKYIPYHISGMGCEPYNCGCYNYLEDALKIARSFT